MSYRTSRTLLPSYRAYYPYLWQVWRHKDHGLAPGSQSKMYLDSEASEHANLSAPADARIGAPPELFLLARSGTTTEPVGVGVLRGHQHLNQCADQWKWRSLSYQALTRSQRSCAHMESTLIIPAAFSSERLWTASVATRKVQLQRSVRTRITPTYLGSFADPRGERTKRDLGLNISQQQLPVHIISF